MELKYSFSELPQRIQDQLRELGHDDANFLCAIKTEFKPNSTIPSLWVVLTNHRLLLCSTHKTRGYWDGYTPGELSCIKLSRGFTGRIQLEILYADIERPDLSLLLSVNTSDEEAEELIVKCNEFIRHSLPREGYRVLPPRSRKRISS